ncbi:MAG: helix-turn-helix domain-containing protein [Clostridiales bacterium]|nr:helix-turn-helix domain-containing protein [Clostridiales bacterium]
MFSKFPAYTMLVNYKTPKSVIKTFEFHHSTVFTPCYYSRGCDRKNETHSIFHYTIKGRGEVIYKGERYQTAAGEGFFNIINEEDSGYGYPEDSKEPWEFIVVCFEGETVRDIVKDLLEEKVIYNINEPELFCSLCKRLIEQNNLGMRLTFFQRLLELLYSQTTSEQKISKEFQNIVEKNLLTNPTIDAIASQMKISREHLQREYSKQTGKTPAYYLNKKRFEKLVCLLAAGVDDFEIMRTMNFSSIASLSAFLKKNTGFTLKQYRKQGCFI